MRPSLESLRILEACVSAGSFVRAAQRLFLTPAAVSMRIRVLEEELGEDLFVRRGPRVVPTPKAIALSAGVRRALGEIDASLDEFERAATRLRVTAPPTFAARWLAPRLPSYQRSEIELDVSVELRDPSDFDVAIRTGIGDWPGLTGYRLFPVQLTPLLSPTLIGNRSEITPEELSTLTLLPHPDWPNWFRQATGDVPGSLTFARVEYPNHELNVSAARAGEGVALVPPGFYHDLIRSGVLIAPFDCVLDGPKWHVALIRNDNVRPACREFCDWLVEQSHDDLRGRNDS